MNYFSLNNRNHTTTFREAAISGLAPDGGLYFPQFIPRFDKDFISNLKNQSREAIAMETMSPFIGACIPKKKLESILFEAIDFEIPLVQISDKISSLELFHGPTLAFKDVGARFMSRSLGYFARKIDRPITVLVATSGDTGGAVASGFYKVPGVEVIILYPEGRVSEVQELQLTAMGENIKALRVKGSFDDCQALVKKAFSDKTLSEKYFLTSANSINIARWLPQQIYYLLAIKQWQNEQSPVISVPSGNFGNLAAGILACKRGLPVKHFIAACNLNDTFITYLKTGNYTPQKSVITKSNAMDVGNPSNFIRIVETLGSVNEVRKTISGYSTSDEITIDTIRTVKSKHNYLLDPHGAVGYDALIRYQAEYQDSPGIFLETAHPVKFAPVVEPIIGEKMHYPESVKELQLRQKKFTQIAADYQSLLEVLM